MDPQFAFATREDIWRVHEDMKLIQTVQAEQAERLSRVERRQEDDARLKSVWGTSSPFPGVLSGTPQQEPTAAPPGAEFSNFDGGEPHNLLSSLHLDHEEEPRRGASRANSVRFDESAKHGHGTRPSGEFYPARTSSGLGSHPMTERSSSHKSDGRHSSAGHSVHSAVSIHSARTNSLGLDTSFPSSHPPGTPFEGDGPPPGLMFLGSVPSIIRCWLNTDFSHGSLLYAVVCTGSAESMVDSKLVHRLGLDDDVAEDRHGVLKVRLPVYLTEAVVKKASSRSNSPSPQLPSMTVDFTVGDLRQHAGGTTKLISVFLGSDTLRAHNADVLLSQNCISMLGDDHSKISVPLVRPEDEGTFKCLRTTYVSTDHDPTEDTSQLDESPRPNRLAELSNNKSRAPKKDSEVDRSREEHTGSDDGVVRTSSPAQLNPKPSPSTLKGKPDSTTTKEKPVSASSSHARSSKEFEGSDRGSIEVQRSISKSITNTSNSSEPGSDAQNATSSASPGGGIWSSWRRESSSAKAPAESSPGGSAQPVGSGSYQRPSRGRGMKVLRPSKSTTLTSTSSTQSPPVSSHANGANEPQDENANPGGTKSTSQLPLLQTQPPASSSTDTKTAGSSKEARSATGQPPGATPPSAGRSSNPVGGASAFAWLKGGGPGKRTSSGVSTPAQE